jgi:hypothetical protein
MRSRLRLFVALFLGLLAPACGGSAPYYAQGGGGPKSAGYAPAADSYGGYAAERPAQTSTQRAQAPAAAPSGASEAWGGGGAVAPQPAPDFDARTRPGLGTEWGETRESRVHEVSFVRADPDHPFAVAALHYNDRQGVQALAAYHQDSSARFRDVPAGGGAITVSIRGEGGIPLEGFHVGDRMYVVGEPGQRYSIVLINHTSRRFESVATVDGLDVVNGRPGSTTQRGYVLMPYATLSIDGFRQSEDAVAAFRFASVGDSYAAQTGSARNVGVIGIAFFSERGDAWTPWTDGELHVRDTASPFPADPRFAPPPPR